MTTVTAIPRPNVLAHPSPTTGRFLLLIGALLGAGLLAGTLVHNGARGDSWAAAARACFAQADTLVPVLETVEQGIEHNNAVVACLAPAERVRAWFSLGGAALIAVFGVLVLAVIPPVLRRRRRLRPAGDRLSGASQRIAELSQEAGVRRPPRLVVGPAGQRDAFVFGLPGRYYLVLPTALVVRWRNGALFDPVVRHELAHLRRHDVPMAWLATAVWLAAMPVLAMPVVVAVARWDLSLMPAYLWRAGLVMAVIWLIRRQLLRSREHDADLFAARQSGDWRPLCTVLERTTIPKRGWWRRFLSHHPTVAQRLRVLADPGQVRGVSVVDGLAAGFLTGLLLPLVFSILALILTGTEAFAWVAYLAAAAIGPLAGLAVGVGLWRQAMIDHVTGAVTWPGGAVFGVVAGLLLGQGTRLNDLGLIEEWSYSVPVAIVVGAAAVLLSAGMGRLWADAAARLPGGPRSWWFGFAVNGLVFIFALWLLTWVPVNLAAFGAGGFGLETVVLTAGGLNGPMFYVVLVPLLIAATAMVWRGRVLPAPQWLIDGSQVVWPQVARAPGFGAAMLSGAVPGALAAIAVTLYRVIVGSPVDDDDRIGRYVLWLATGTLVALAVSFVTLMLVPRSGAGVGLLTGGVAAIVAGCGTTSLNTVAFGNILDLAFWLSTTMTMVALWLIGYLFLLPLTLALWPVPWRNVPGWLLLAASVIAAVVVALSVVGLAVTLRQA